LEEELKERKSGATRDRDVADPKSRLSLDRVDEIVAREFLTRSKALKAQWQSMTAFMDMFHIAGA